MAVASLARVAAVRAVRVAKEVRVDVIVDTDTAAVDHQAQERAVRVVPMVMEVARAAESRASQGLTDMDQVILSQQRAGVDLVIRSQQREVTEDTAVDQAQGSLVRDLVDMVTEVEDQAVESLARPLDMVVTDQVLIQRVPRAMVVTDRDLILSQARDHPVVTGMDLAVAQVNLARVDMDRANLERDMVDMVDRQATKPTTERTYEEIFVLEELIKFLPSPSYVIS